MLRYILLGLLIFPFFAPLIPSALAAVCADCHPSYNTAVNSSKHSQTVNASAPACTDCHNGYEPVDNHTSGTKGYIVNESNSCRKSACHGSILESHGNKYHGPNYADCTKCHFANTTQRFGLNNSLFTHNHNLTVEYNFFNYSLYGIPLSTNGGVGKGMFPYYTCTLTCHSGSRSIESEIIGWNQSAHARSLHMTGDNKNSCAKCKSPPNYNTSLSSGAVIAQANWQGIQCRVCHNLHNDTYSGKYSPAFPLAFYNSTLSSNAHTPVYETVANSTVLCEKCHTTTSHDSKFAGPHKDTTGFTCANCHANSSFNSLTHTFEVKNTTSGVTGCEVCHEYPGTEHSAVSAFHGNVECWACHDNTVSANATGYVVSSDNNYGIFKDPSTGNWTTYKLDHGLPKAWPLHNISKNVTCSKCHGAKSVYNGTISSFDIQNVRNCVGCHDTGGPAPEHVDVSAASNNNSVHSTLNSNAATSLDTNNLRCWACHGDGDGSEEAQPSGTHPSNYNSPKNCNNNDCHSISQSRYNETMIYSHFQNASLNNNPNNVTNYNITTAEQCQSCHANSLVTTDNYSNLSLVSHYGSKENLFDSFNCVYCHMDKDNSEKWGNATLINKNRTGTVLLEKERNKFTVSERENVYLGEGYFLKLVGISDKREEAIIDILKNDSVMDEVSLGVLAPYTYEITSVIDNATMKIPAITLNITSIHKSDNNSFIQFEGSRLRKIHTQNEGKNSACYACHLYRHSQEKQMFQVIEREIGSRYDTIYYAKVLVDFKAENKSKIYFNDEDYMFNQLEDPSARYLASPSKQKYLKEGETWNIGDNYSLNLKEASTDSKHAWLVLTVNNSIVKDEAVSVGSEFIYTAGIRYKDYTETNVTLFSANVSAIFQGSTNFILLQNVVALSPQIEKTSENTTIFGYNSSWFWSDDTFTSGKIPYSLHSPNLYVDTKNWADCVSCHQSSKNLRIPDVNALLSGLGMHSTLNTGASNTASLSDPVDKACWACHSNGTEPQMHSPPYTAPRNCRSCHVYQTEPNYGAMNISDELHASLSDCENCHIGTSHNLTRPPGSPMINEAALSKSEITLGETLTLSAKASAGYAMKTRSAEYFIDTIGNSGDGISLKPVDGSFDSQIEQVTADINTSNTSAGKHVIYIHAMERNNRWGKFSGVNFSIISNKMEGKIQNIESLFKRIPALDAAYALISLLAAYLIVLRHGRS